MSECWTQGQAPGSEAEILELIDSFFESRTPHTPLGRGHDCAVLADLEGRLAISTDMFWQDRHFRTSYFKPEEAGAKALSSAVSDLAAAGAVPMGFTLNLQLPSWLGVKTLGKALSGMAAKARDFGIVLAGGDLSGGDQLGFALTVWGAAIAPDAPFLRRATAEPGDRVFIVGEAGLALVGLLELEKSGRGALQDWPLACAAHLDPCPLLAEGQAIARLAATPHCPTPRLGLMDLSDGLARDLPRLLGPHGILLTFDPALFSPELVRAAALYKMPVEQLFLHGGEDYALLGSCAEELWPRLREAVPAAKSIGRVCPEPGMFVGGKPVFISGFDHFSGGATGPDALRASGPLQNPRIAKAAKALIKSGREAGRAGLMTGFNGNISCRVKLPGHDKGGEAMLITRSGSAKSRLEPGDLTLLCMSDGRRLAGQDASSELDMHLELYRVCPGSSFILHSHPPRLLALSLRLPPEERLALPLPEAERYRELMAQAPCCPPGSKELAVAVAEAAKSRPAVWMEGHGLVVHGSDWATLIALSEELEQLALIQLESFNQR